MPCFLFSFSLFSFAFPFLLFLPPVAFFTILVICKRLIGRTSPCGDNYLHVDSSSLKQHAQIIHSRTELATITVSKADSESGEYKGGPANRWGDDPSSNVPCLVAVLSNLRPWIISQMSFRGRELPASVESLGGGRYQRVVESLVIELLPL